MKSFFNAFIVLLITFSLTPKLAHAQLTEEWKDLQTAPNRCIALGDVATIQGLECLFINVVRVLTPIVGLLLFVMLIVGSLKYLTSGGDPKKTQAAQQTLTWAIAGVVIFFGIWFILQLIHAITGVDPTEFRISD
jgi:hypothetical protein